MNKIFRVAITEFLVAVRSKAFIIGILFIPVIIVLSFAAQKFAREKTDLEIRHFAVVDETGFLFEVIKEQAEERNAHGLFQTNEDGEKKQVNPEFIPKLYQPAEDEDIELTLSNKVRAKEMMAFVIIEEEGLLSESEPSAGVRYYTETPTYTALPDWLRQVIQEEVKRRRFLEANLDEAWVQKLSRSVPFQKMGLAKSDPKGGVTRAKKENQLKTFGVPFVAMFLVYILIMSAAPALMNNVLEEKLQKIAEVLISSITPFQLLMGKLLGAILSSLTLGVLYLGTIVLILWRHNMLEMVPFSLYIWLLIFQVLGLMIFGSICSAIGAACNEIKDAQNMLAPVIMIIIFPLLTWMPILQNPTTPFARALSFFPPATPMIMLLRIAVPPGLPLWEILLGVLVCTLFTLLCVAAAAKIFRIGILSQGQSPSIKKMLGWLFS